jgi:hypothetical protein
VPLQASNCTLGTVVFGLGCGVGARTVPAKAAVVANEPIMIAAATGIFRIGFPDRSVWNWRAVTLLLFLTGKCALREYGK